MKLRHSSPKKARRNFFTDGNPVPQSSDDPLFWTPLTIVGVGVAVGGLLWLNNLQTARYMMEIWDVALDTAPSQSTQRAVESNRVVRELSDDMTPLMLYFSWKDLRKALPTEAIIWSAYLAFATRLYSDERRLWLRRVKRFPSIGAAIGIGVLGTATTFSAVYALERHDELCRDRLGFYPYYDPQSKVVRHLIFSKLDGCTHRLNAWSRGVIRREKWISCLETLLETGFLPVLMIGVIRHNPVLGTLLWGAVSFGMPLYYHIYPLGGAGQVASNLPLWLPIQEAIANTVSVTAYLATGRLAVPIFIHVATEVFECALMYPAILPFSIAFKQSSSRRGGSRPSPPPPAVDEEGGKK